MSEWSIPVSERESVVKVCTCLHHAYRGLRLYPAAHPTARQAMDSLARAITSHVDKMGRLFLQVDEMKLLYEGEEVYSYEGSRDNLAFLMFRDGIRFVSFHPGVEPLEIEDLVDCLSHADDLADLEHDLTTALWEREMMHIEYEVVDPFLSGGEMLRSQAVDDLRDTVIRRLSELSPVRSAAGAADGDGVGGGGEGTEASQSITQPVQDEPGEDETSLQPGDIESIEKTVADAADPLDDFALVLLEIIGAGLQTPTGDDALVRSLSLVVQQFLDAGDVDGLTLVFERLRTLEEQGRRAPGFGGDVIGEAVTARRLTQLITKMSTADREGADRIEKLLSDMRAWIYPALLETLAEDSDRAVRKTVLALLDAEGGVPVKHLWPLMRDSRWYVVRNAVQLATGSDDPALPGQLERLLRHPDARVRREVMRSLDVMGGARAAPLLVRALTDEDSAVRTLAVRSLGRHGGRGNFTAVRSQVDSKEFETRPSEEIEAFLLTFALMGGDSALDTLNKLWKRRMFGTKPLPIRVAAVQALSLIPSKAARTALAEAAKSGDAQVQRAATRGAAEAQTRGTVPRQ